MLSSLVTPSVSPTGTLPGLFPRPRSCRFVRLIFAFRHPTSLFGTLTGKQGNTPVQWSNHAFRFGILPSFRTSPSSVPLWQILLSAELRTFSSRRCLAPRPRTFSTAHLFQLTGAYHNVRNRADKP